MVASVVVCRIFGRAGAILGQGYIYAMNGAFTSFVYKERSEDDGSETRMKKKHFNNYAPIGPQPMVIVFMEL